MALPSFHVILDFSFVNLKFLFCKIELVPVDLWIFFFKIYFTVWGYSAQLIEHVPVLGLIPVPYKTDLVASAHSLSSGVKRIRNSGQHSKFETSLEHV